MAELARRSALAGVLEPGLLGRPDFRGPGITLAERHPLSLVEIDAASGEIADAMCEEVAGILGMLPPAEPGTAAGTGQPRILWTGPWRWLVVEPESRDLAGLLEPAAGASRDLSHARTVLRLGGRDVRRLFMKGAPLDWHPSVFVPGCCAQTGMFHQSVLVDCREPEVFDLFVARGYARDFLERVIDAGAEYGVQVS